MADVPALRLIHFNDVYNIAPGRHEPVGGASRFVTALRQARLDAYESYQGLQTLTVFSGDVFSPSPITPHTGGEEMPPVLNAARVDIACIGNHDMDLGVPTMYERMSETNFPWLLTNASFKDAHEPGFESFGAKLKTWHVIERAGIRFGFMGLIPEQWIDTLACVPRERIDYEDFIKAANETSRFLREQQNVDIIVGLTHMRQNDDARVAEEAEDIDLILGGHDHAVDISKKNGRWIVKSGTDFRNFTHLNIIRTGQGTYKFEKPKVETVTMNVREDFAIHRLVKKYEYLFEDGDSESIAHADVDLDGRFCAIRSRETTLGNLVCDIMTNYMEADIGLINGGTFRSDRIHEQGEIYEKDLNEILPFVDDLVVIDITGRQVLEALENSCSQYPALEGRFCQVSGIKFTFDGNFKCGERVLAESVSCYRRSTNEWGPLDVNARYHVAVKYFMAQGKDGFDRLAERDRPDVRESKNGEDLKSLVLKHIDNMNDENGDDEVRLAPKVEGRIVCVNPDEKLEKSCKCP